MYFFWGSASSIARSVGFGSRNRSSPSRMYSTNSKSSKSWPSALSPRTVWFRTRRASLRLASASSGVHPNLLHRYSTARARKCFTYPHVLLYSVLQVGGGCSRGPRQGPLPPAAAPLPAPGAAGPSPVQVEEQGLHPRLRGRHGHRPPAPPGRPGGPGGPAEAAAERLQCSPSRRFWPTAPPRGGGGLVFGTVGDGVGSQEGQCRRLPPPPAPILHRNPPPTHGSGLESCGREGGRAP